MRSVRTAHVVTSGSCDSQPFYFVLHSRTSSLKTSKEGEATGLDQRRQRARRPGVRQFQHGGSRHAVSGPERK